MIFVLQYQSLPVDFDIAYVRKVTESWQSIAAAITRSNPCNVKVIYAFSLLYWLFISV